MLLNGKNIFGDQADPLTPAKLKQMVQAARTRPVGSRHASDRRSPGRRRYGPVAGRVAAATARHGSVDIAMNLAFIPSPSHGVVHLGPIPLRGYAFCIIIGVFVAVWLGNKRWIARGGRSGTVADIAVWAVPFGLVGGRLYHVITDYELYFSEGRDWVDAFKIWEGGLGIWGAIALGAVGAWIGCRRRGIPLPGLRRRHRARHRPRAGHRPLGQLVQPGAVRQAHRPAVGPEDHVARRTGRVPGTYHPTFLYESLWCIGVALLVIWADRRFKLGHGRAFALYVAAYCVGRFWIEYMRVDDAHHILGLRLNDWTAIGRLPARGDLHRDLGEDPPRPRGGRGAGRR